jgi:death on curing protein
MKFLFKEEIILLHARLIAISGGSPGIRDMGALDSSVAQPHMTFGGIDVYPEMVDKACALGFFLIANHPFIDGNKRIGQAGMETVLLMNGLEISASIDTQEQIILDVAAGKMDREDFTEWVRKHITPYTR